MVRRRLLGLVVGLLLSLPLQAAASPLTFSFADPIDATGAGRIDLIGAVLHFDNATGVYSIDLTATAANPFAGSFRINMNWLNIDAALADQFFSDSANDFTLGAPTTLLTLTGTDSALLGWAAGNRVAVNNGPFGNPTVPAGIFAFRSQVIDPTFAVFDNLGVGTGPSTADFGVVTSAVPEPATLLLFGTGLAALAVRRRLRG